MSGYKEDRKLLLHRLVMLIKSVYPGTHTQVPAEISAMYSYVDREDYLLYESLVHCLTVLNRPSRLQEGQRLLSSQRDLLNALHLLLPSSDQLTPRMLNYYDQLKSFFDTDWFNYHQAASCLKVSERTVYRMVKVMVLYGLLDRDYEGVHQQIRLRIAQGGEDSAISMFSEANEDWNDFLGFVEF